MADAMKTGKRNNKQDEADLRQILALVNGLLGSEAQEDQEEVDEGEASGDTGYMTGQDLAGGKAISAREDVNPKEGKQKYGNVDFADEKNKKYPIDSETHIRSAWSYINQDKNAAEYSADEVKAIKDKIVAAWKDKIDKAGPPSAKSMNLSYAKSMGLALPDTELSQLLAVKSVGIDLIRHPVFIWGHPNKVDVEQEYFDRNTNFWDDSLKNTVKPLTWDHMQDETLKASPIIGKTVEWEDDEVGRWAISQLDRAHRYRKAVDMLIEQGALGSSSDTALQYVVRQPTKSGATYIAQWPWFASALTTTPAEPRTIEGLDYFKSIGVIFPTSEATDNEQARAMEATLKAKNLKIRNLYGV